jgi:hypothetical protein
MIDAVRTDAPPTRPPADPDDSRGQPEGADGDARRSAPVWIAPSVIVVAAVAAYLPVVVVPYAFEDDYWILGATHGLGGANVWKSTSADGRPILGLLLTGVFSLVSDIDSLRLVRLISVVGIGLLGVALYAALRKAGTGRWLATAIALSLVVLPSFQVYVSWAVLFAAPYAGVLAGLAWVCSSSTSGVDRRGFVVRVVLAAALLFIALLTYQPAAMLFWVFAAIDLLSPNARLSESAKKFVVGLVIAGAALVAAYAVVKVGAQHYGAPGGGRTALTHDLLGKLRWFWDQPLLNALNPFDLVPSWTIAGVTIGVATVGIVLLHARRRWAALGFLGIAVVLVPLSYLPNLVVVEDWASYRSIGALSALLMLYGWFGLWGIARVVTAGHDKSRSRLPARSVAGAVAAALVITGLVLAARNVTTLFAKPESLEHQMLRSALASHDVARVRRVVFIKPNWSQGAAPLVRYDEFGLPSAFAPWVPDPAVKLVLREQGGTQNPAVEVLAWDQAARVPRGSRVTVVDMRKLRQHRVGWNFWSLRAADSG